MRLETRFITGVVASLILTTPAIAANEPDLNALRNQLASASKESSVETNIIPTSQDLEAKEAALIARIENSEKEPSSEEMVPLVDTSEPGQNPGAESKATKSLIPSAKNEDKEIEALKGDVERANQEAQTLKTSIEAKAKEADELKRELDKVKNQLTLAEMQVERLSQIVESQNRKALGVYLPEKNQAVVVKDAPKSSTPGVKRTVKLSDKPAPPKSEETASAIPDVQFLTVTADKANLRAGPGNNNSVLMTVQRGSRLAIETRQGSWYRVTSPTGNPAWVSSDVVAFGPDALSRPSSTLRIKGIGQ